MENSLYECIYDVEIKILGITYAITLEHSMNVSWANVTGKVRAQTSYT
jgi:hypothetical protein